MVRTKWVSLLLMCIVIVACNKTDKESTQQRAPAAKQPIPVEQQSEVQKPLSAFVPQSPPPALEPEKTKSSEATRNAAQPEKTLKTEKKSAQVQKAKDIPIEEVAPVVEATPSVVVTQVEPPASMPPATPQPRYAIVPSGIAIQIRLQDPLDSGVNLTGDTFRAILDQDIAVDGVLIAPRGSILDGKISHSERSGRVQGRATMALQLIALHIGQQAYPIQTQILSFEAESSQKKDAGKVGIGAGLGAVIGAIAGGGKGAAIGAAVGAGAGGATVMATRGNEVKLDSEQRLSFSLQRDVKIQLPSE